MALIPRHLRPLYISAVHIYSLPRSPIHISPFLALNESPDSIWIKDMVSGIELILNAAGAYMFRQMSAELSSYALSEVLFRLWSRPSTALSQPSMTQAQDCFSNLRIAPTNLLREYIINTFKWRQLENAAFADYIRTNTNDAMYDPSITYSSPKESFVLYHSWRLGMLPTNYDLNTLSRSGLSENDAAVAETVSLLRKANWLSVEPTDLLMLVDRAFDSFPAMQNRRELLELLQFVEQRRPRLILEIGTARGGLLYCLSQLASSDATIISIDIPGYANGGGQTENERKVFRTFGSGTQQIHFIPADSHHPETFRRVVSMLGGSQIDLLVIDGDHSYSGVKTDFLMYGRLVAKHGYIVFHDILMFPDEWGRGNEVGLFWREVKHSHRTTEIIDPAGVCRRLHGGKLRSWGFGIVEHIS